MWVRSCTRCSPLCNLWAQLLWVQLLLQFELCLLDAQTPGGRVSVKRGRSQIESDASSDAESNETESGLM